MNQNRSTDDVRQNLESILYGYYIKYTKMQDLVNTAFANFRQDTNIISIYIDLYDMLKPIYGRNIYANKQYIIVSAVINLAAHIREYFKTRHRMWARIYFVYGENNTLNHKQFYPSFGDDQIRATIDYDRNHSMIKSQLELVKILAAYIKDVYYVEKNVMFSIFAYDNIIKNPKVPAIIWTKSKYAAQIPAMEGPNVVLFRPKKYAGEDNSIVLFGQFVLLQYYNNLSRDKTIEYLSKISPQLLSVIMTMAGLNDYNVNMVVNSTKAIRLLHDSIMSNKILNAYNGDCNYVYSNIDELSKYIDQTSFSFRFKAIDLVYQHMIYSQSPESLDYTWQIDLNDPNTVREINDKYFFDNPLDLNSL